MEQSEWLHISMSTYKCRKKVDIKYDETPCIRLIEPMQGVITSKMV